MASPSQLRLPNPFGGAVFIFGAEIGLKALKTRYFAYFSGQWGGLKPPSPGYTTDLASGCVEKNAVGSFNAITISLMT